MPPRKYSRSPAVLSVCHGGEVCTQMFCTILFCFETNASTLEKLTHIAESMGLVSERVQAELSKLEAIPSCAKLLRDSKNTRHTLEELIRGIQVTSSKVVTMPYFQCHIRKAESTCHLLVKSIENYLSLLVCLGYGHRRTARS